MIGSLNFFFLFFLPFSFYVSFQNESSFGSVEFRLLCMIRRRSSYLTQLKLFLFKIFSLLDLKDTRYSVDLAG